MEESCRKESEHEENVTFPPLTKRVRSCTEEKVNKDVFLTQSLFTSISKTIPTFLCHLSSANITSFPHQGTTTIYKRTGRPGVKVRREIGYFTVFADSSWEVTALGALLRISHFYLANFCCVTTLMGVIFCFQLSVTTQSRLFIDLFKIRLSLRSNSNKTQFSTFRKHVKNLHTPLSNMYFYIFYFFVYCFLHQNKVKIKKYRETDKGKPNNLITLKFSNLGQNMRECMPNFFPATRLGTVGYKDK